MKKSWLSNRGDAQRLKAQAQLANGQRLVGCEVVWANDVNGTGETMRVESVTFDGMVRVTGYSGDFAPHLFRVVLR